MPSASIPFVFAFLSLSSLAAACDSSSAPEPGQSQGPTTTVAAKNTDSVFVENTAAAPVPTQAIGTTAVAGTVSAAQSGAWSVGVAGGSVGATQQGAWSVGAAQSGAWSVAATQSGPWTVAIGSAPPVALAAGSTVAVSSLPPVAIAGTPSVTIANTPSVSIAGTPSVSVSGAVTVANTAASAVPVRVIGAAAQTPWVVTIGFYIVNGDYTGSVDVAQIPAGKRLVIEGLTALSIGPTGTGDLYGAIMVGTTTVYDVSLHYVMTSDNREHSVATEVVKAYASAGQFVQFALTRADNGTQAWGRVTLSGYLVDL